MKDSHSFDPGSNPGTSTLNLMNGAKIDGLDLTGANLTGAVNWYTTIATVIMPIFSNTICPDGTDSDMNLGGTC